MKENPNSNAPKIQRGPEARIALAKCPERKDKVYGVRFQKDDDGWHYTWAFPIEEASAKREGYSDTMILGDFNPSQHYPGCPYCGTDDFVICSNCHHLTCRKRRSIRPCMTE